MGRFILRYRGAGAAPAADLARLRGLPGLSIIDDSSRMMLVEAAEHLLRGLVGESPDWVMTPETSYDLPPSHPSLGKARGLKKPK